MPDQPPGGDGPEAAAPRAAATPVDIKAIFDLKPAEAIAFLRAKRPQITVAWSEMLHEEHGAAFTVAHVAKLDLLDDMQASLVQAQEDGVPFEQWQAEIKPTLIDKGWWGLVTDETITGTADPVFIGPRRLRTIYDTNLRMSRAKGQWSRIQAIKAKRPFLRYSAVMDSRTRPQHAAWHGTILPVDHVFWLTHFPPCGWRCRCAAQQLSQRDLDHRGWHVTPDAKVPDLTATVPFYRKGATTPIFVPRGVDPGFAYNPGISRIESASTKAAQSLIDAHAAGNGDAAAAVLDELLGDAAPAKLPDSAVPALLRLIEAGDRDGLAKLLAEVMRTPVSTALRDERLTDLARNAMVGPTPAAEAIDLGLLSAQEIVDLAAATNRDFTGWSRIVRNFEARKVMNKHGDPAQAKALGQIPTTPEDFALVPEIVRQGQITDHRERAPNRGKPSSITRVAEIDGHEYTLVEYILSGVRRLALQSLWKK